LDWLLRIGVAGTREDHDSGGNKNTELDWCLHLWTLNVYLEPVDTVAGFLFSFIPVVIAIYGVQPGFPALHLRWDDD
jgi:hypothetical protein